MSLSNLKLERSVDFADAGRYNGEASVASTQTLPADTDAHKVALAVWSSRDPIAVLDPVQNHWVFNNNTGETLFYRIHGHINLDSTADESLVQIYRELPDAGVIASSFIANQAGGFQSVDVDRIVAIPEGESVWQVRVTRTGITGTADVATSSYVDISRLGPRVCDEVTSSSS